LRFIESQDFNTNIAKGYIDHQFVLSVCLVIFISQAMQANDTSSCWISSTRKIPGTVISSRRLCIAFMANS
jgi:hypothetical protein